LGPGEASRQAIVQSRSAFIAPHDLIITDALKGRRTKSNHRTAEVRAFHDLTELAMRSPEAAVQRFLELAMELCGAGSAGWSRLTQNVSREEVFSWDALAGECSPYVGRVMPRHLSPCGLCLDAGKTILVSRPAQIFSSFSIDAPVIEALLVPVYDVSGIALGVLWVVHHDDRLFDAHDARVMEELSVQLVLALKLMGDAKTHGHEIADKVALIRDTDHRVKNTLQSVASLLSLQARSCRVQEARKAIEEAAARLSIFGTVHELLHGNTGDSRAVNIGLIVEKLVDALKATRSEDDRSILLTVQADHVLLEPSVALSISLLVNEAITNAYKHAYPDGTGEIFVRVAQTAGGGLRIGIQDDGIGFSPDVPGGLGLTLIRSFASQLRGELLVQSGSSGTLISVTVEQQIPIARHSPNPLRGERET
jgi:two-component sensor histidine kinase